MTSRRPALAAHISAVSLSWACASMSALPSLTSTSTASTWPRDAAALRGSQPKPSWMPVFAPWASSTRMTPTWPDRAAPTSAMSPYSSGTFGSPEVMGKPRPRPIAISDSQFPPKHAPILGCLDV